MMSMFPRSFCAPAEVSFTPLFRLLEDFDNHSREVRGTPACNPRRPRQPRSSLASFNPKFDVRETENTYELHGELPGLERENVSIEFTEPQTIVIRGRVERSYGPDSNNTNSNGTTNNNNTAASAENTNPEASESGAQTSRRNSYQATVEDDPEDVNTPISTPAASPKTEVAKPAASDKAESQTQDAVTRTATPSTQDEPKYWLWERSVGGFSRTFSFPARVDQDGVTASLNNGILSVSVPKARKPTTRRIEITA